MSKINTTKEILKAATTIALAVATVAFIFRADSGWEELNVLAAIACGFACYTLANKWYQDELDDKSGISGAIDKERE